MKTRRHNFNRAKRLTDAVTWLDEYSGNKLVSKYSKRYGVDNLCAAIELNKLGVVVNISNFKNRSNKITTPKLKPSFCEIESQATGFDLVLGYTSGGLPFGIYFEEE